MTCPEPPERLPQVLRKTSPHWDGDGQLKNSEMLLNLKEELL